MLEGPKLARDTLARRLRRRPAKPMGSPRVGSNPTGVVLCLQLAWRMRAARRQRGRPKQSTKRCVQCHQRSLHPLDAQSVGFESGRLARIPDKQSQSDWGIVAFHRKTILPHGQFHHVEFPPRASRAAENHFQCNSTALALAWACANLPRAQPRAQSVSRAVFPRRGAPYRPVSVQARSANSLAAFATAQPLPLLPTIGWRSLSWSIARAHAKAVVQRRSFAQTNRFQKRVRAIMRYVSTFSARGRVPLCARSLERLCNKPPNRFNAHAGAPSAAATQVGYHTPVILRGSDLRQKHHADSVTEWLR